jgi:hypothetical protein
LREFVADHLAHVIAAVVIVAVLGAARLTRAVANVYGRQRASQAILLVWALLAVVMVYQAPLTVGVFVIAFVVLFFGEHHLRAWVAEQLGPDALLRSGRDLLRKRGPFRYAAVVAIRPALQTGLAIVVLALSPNSEFWEFWLGLGLLAGAALGLLAEVLSIWRGWRALGPEPPKQAA